MKIFIATLTVMLAIQSASAKVNQQVQVVKIEKLANSFFLNKAALEQNYIHSLVTENQFNHDPHCGHGHYPPSPTNCINEACTRLGQSGCNEQSEIQDVASACRGVDGNCITETCAYLGQSGCNEMSEIQTVGNACRQMFDIRCMKLVCSYIGQQGCNELSEISGVGSACSGRVDTDCVESVCRRLGANGCNELSEIQTVTRACGGKN